VANGSKRELVDHPSVRAALAEATAEFGDEGRVVLRPSGTEPLIRVMVEGPDAEAVRRLAEAVAAAVRSAASDTEGDAAPVPVGAPASARATPAVE
jgi:phosphomannomutase